MSVAHDPRQNHLLAALPAADFERVQSRLKLVSLLYIMTDGASAEIAVVGNDGVLGIALFMGGETTPSRAVVQSSGHAYRLAGNVLKDEFNRAGALQHVLLRYTQALLTQMAQTAVCNRHHTPGSATVSVAVAQFGNGILRALLNSEYQHLRPRLEQVHASLACRHQSIGRVQPASLRDAENTRAIAMGSASVPITSVSNIACMRHRCSPSSRWAIPALTSRTGATHDTCRTAGKGR